MQLGWIGLGHMGVPMALRLRRAGHPLHVYNRTANKTEALVAEGATSLSSPRELAEQSDILFIMLADGNAVESVLRQDDGLLASDLKNKIVVNLSTISPEESTQFAHLVEQTGATYLESPVSGSVGVAEAGQLVMLVGGDEATLETCRPYLHILGKESIHFGGHGTGSSAKLAINLLLGIIGEGLAETFLLAEGAGLDKEKIIQMISLSGMNTPLFQGKQDMYRKEEFPPAFPLRLMAKDLGLITDAAKRYHLNLPLAEAAREQYKQANTGDQADLDMAAIYLSLKNQ